MFIVVGVKVCEGLTTVWCYYSCQRLKFLLVVVFGLPLRIFLNYSLRYTVILVYSLVICRLSFDRVVGVGLGEAFYSPMIRPQFFQ